MGKQAALRAVTRVRASSARSLLPLAFPPAGRSKRAPSARPAVETILSAKKAPTVRVTAAVPRKDKSLLGTYGNRNADRQATGASALHEYDHNPSLAVLAPGIARKKLGRLVSAAPASAELTKLHRAHPTTGNRPMTASGFSSKEFRKLSRTTPFNPIFAQVLHSLAYAADPAAQREGTEPGGAEARESRRQMIERLVKIPFLDEHNKKREHPVRPVDRIKMLMANHVRETGAPPTPENIQQAVQRYPIQGLLPPRPGKARIHFGYRQHPSGIARAHSLPPEAAEVLDMSSRLGQVSSKWFGGAKPSTIAEHPDKKNAILDTASAIEPTTPKTTSRLDELD